MAKKLKVDKKPTFKKKAHERQFSFNQELKDKLESASAAANATPPALEKVKQALKEGEVLIKERQKLIQIADRSEHGWATVEEYVADELADDSDDEKRLYKAEGRAGRKIKEAKAKTKKKPLRKSPPWWQPKPGVTSQGVFNTGQSSTQFTQPSKSPAQPVPQVLGPCFQCGKMGHFRRACPLLAQNTSK